MGYRQQIIRIDFPELGDDVWVDIRNPRLLPVDPTFLPPDPTLERGAFFRKSLENGRKVVCRLVIAWNVWDVAQSPNGHEPDPLPIPSVDETSLDRCPDYVMTRILQEANELSRPPERSPATTSSSTS